MSGNMSTFSYVPGDGGDGDTGTEISFPHADYERIVLAEDVDGRKPEPTGQIWMGESTCSFVMDITFSDLLLESATTLDQTWSFKLHSAIVCAKSGYIRAQCELSNQQGDHEVRGIDIARNVMKTVIRFMYSGVYQIIGYEVDNLQYPKIEPQGTDGSMIVASKVFRDMEAAIDLEIPGMVQAIMDAVGADLKEVRNMRSLLGNYAIRLLCKIFAIRGTRGHWNREKMAEIIMRNFSVDHIKAELMVVADHDPDGLDTIFYTGGFSGTLDDCLKELKRKIKLKRRLPDFYREDNLENLPPRIYREGCEPAWCPECDSMEPEIPSLRFRDVDARHFDNDAYFRHIDSGYGYH
ncbi:hypothetical protein TWF281_003738 [Arthrobotrys megalospora]